MNYASRLEAVRRVRRSSSNRELSIRSLSCSLLLAAILLAVSISPGDAREAASSGAPALEVDRGDVLLLGTGLGLSAIGRWVLDPRTRDVPAGGLDRDGIALEWDRRSLGRPDPDAGSHSNLTLLGTAGTPYLLTFLGEDEHPWRTRIQLGRMQVESMVLAMGASLVLKPAASRPRPYTYLAEGNRPPGDDYDVTRDTAFRSFPSTHATLAWASVLSGVTFLARQRPDLPPFLHFLGGLAAGGLATSTSLLRVEGMRHFPTDVAAGMALGGATGLTLTLLRTNGSEEGASRALWTGLAGVTVGTALAFLLSPPTSPWD